MIEQLTDLLQFFALTGVNLVVNAALFVVFCTLFAAFLTLLFRVIDRL